MENSSNVDHCTREKEVELEAYPATADTKAEPVAIHPTLDTKSRNLVDGASMSSKKFQWSGTNHETLPRVKEVIKTDLYIEDSMKETEAYRHWQVEEALQAHNLANDEQRIELKDVRILILRITAAGAGHRSLLSNSLYNQTS